MLYYNRNDVSKGTDVAKSNKSKEYIVCYYWFFNHGFLRLCIQWLILHTISVI